MSYKPNAKKIFRSAAERRRGGLGEARGEEGEGISREEKGGRGEGPNIATGAAYRAGLYPTPESNAYRFRLSRPLL